MGGGAFRGNASPVAEFNIYVDPEAAHMVFKAGVPMVMCGLDVTMQAYATQEGHRRLCRAGEQGRPLLRRHLPFLLRFPHERGARQAARLCGPRRGDGDDPHPTPSSSRGEDAYVEVDLDGQYTLGCTAADFRDRGRIAEKNAHVIMEIDREALYPAAASKRRPAIPKEVL